MVTINARDFRDNIARGLMTQHGCALNENEKCALHGDAFIEEMCMTMLEVANGFLVAGRMKNSAAEPEFMRGIQFSFEKN